MTKMKKNSLTEEQIFKRKVVIRTIFSFGIFFILCIIGFKFFHALTDAPKDRGMPIPLREISEVNAKIFERSYDNPALSKVFPKELAAKRARVNGMIGMRDKLDTSNYFFKVVRYSKLTPQLSDTLLISLDDLRHLPKTEVVFNFKCIEGWSQVSWWGGVRFSDFAKKYNLGTFNNLIPDTKNHPEQLLKYVGLQTPDKKYYVGIDMPSMMHPQTILCYELNGKPLPMDQGSPLRLIIPVKYGIKHLKKVGTIFFSETPPPDYWADRGYDYFSGL